MNGLEKFVYWETIVLINIFQIEKIWIELPDQRFFQLLTNYTTLGTPQTKKQKHDGKTYEVTTGYIKSPFHYEDDDFEKELDKLID